MFRQLKYIVIILLLIAGGTTAKLNYEGFCVSEGRKLSDEERIDIVIQNILDSENGNHYLVDSRGPFNISYENQYKSIKDFKEKNPNCCSVSRTVTLADHFPEADFIDRITGFDRREMIIVNYLSHGFDRDGNEEKHFVKTEYVQTNCGQRKYNSKTEGK